MTDADVMSKVIDSKYLGKVSNLFIIWFYYLGIFDLLSPYLKTMNLQSDNSIFNHLHNKVVLPWKFFFYFALQYLYNSFFVTKMYEKFGFMVGVQSLFPPYLQLILFSPWVLWIPK